jgi:Ca-activated chloride channel family protein
MTHPCVRLIVTFALVAVVSGPRLGGQPAQRPQEPAPPTGRSSAEAVQVSAIVTTANGEEVTGLTREDFEIVENGAPQAITTFSAVNIPIDRRESAGERGILGSDGPEGRVYLIALDEMDPESALRTRQIVRQFLEEYFGLNDAAAIVLLGRGVNADGRQFTSNRQRLLESLDAFNGSVGDGDPLRGRDLVTGLRDATEFLARVQHRRKALIVISEGIGPDALDMVDHRGGVVSLGGEDFQQAVSAATRGNVSIYTLDPGELSRDTGGSAIGADLRGLAQITGGFAVANTNGFKFAFERLVRENSTYYVLGFNATSTQRDARWAQVLVRVRRPGLRVQSVNGHVAPQERGRVEAARTPGSLVPVAWDAVASPLAAGGVPLRVFAAAFRGKDESATIVSLEVAAPKLNLALNDGAYRGDLEIVFDITDAKKKRWKPIRHVASLALTPDVYERVNRTALRALSQLQLPDGRYQVRVSASGAATGSVIYDVTVPDFRDKFSLSGVALTSTQAQQTATVSTHARLDAALPAAPTTAREFARDDTITVFAQAYENRRKAHTIHFTAELRDLSGGTVSTISAERKAATKPQAVSVYTFTPTINLEDLEPGRYTIRVEAGSSLDREKRVSREVPISVR